MFHELIQSRRSIRKFQDKPVESDTIDRLVEAALRAPSSRSLNPWEFIVVTDNDLLKTLAACKPHGASFLKGAPLGIVVLADPNRCDVWIEDASIASIFIHLAAESLGLGSCWIQIRERQHSDGRTAEQYVAEALGIPGHLRVEAIIAIGYPTERKAGHPQSSLQYDKVFFNSYGSGYPRP